MSFLLCCHCSDCVKGSLPQSCFQPCYPRSWQCQSLASYAYKNSGINRMGLGWVWVLSECDASWLRVMLSLFIVNQAVSSSGRLDLSDSCQWLLSVWTPFTSSVTVYVKVWCAVNSSLHTLAAFAATAFVEGMFMSWVLLQVNASFRFHCLVKECDILHTRLGNQRQLENCVCFSSKAYRQLMHEKILHLVRIQHYLFSSTISL